VIDACDSELSQSTGCQQNLPAGKEVIGGWN